MNLNFSFKTTTEVQHLIAALKACPKAESEETQLFTSELITELQKILREAETEWRIREGDGIPY